MEVYLQKNAPVKKTKKSVHKSRNKDRKTIDLQDRNSKSAVGYQKTKYNGKRIHSLTPLVLETFIGDNLIQNTTTDSKIEDCSLPRGTEVLDFQSECSRKVPSKQDVNTENNGEINKSTDVLENEDELITLVKIKKSFDDDASSNQSDSAPKDGTDCQEIPPLPFLVKIIKSKSDAKKEVAKKSSKPRKKTSKVFSEGEAAHTVKRFTGLYTGPYFDPTTTTNITTQLGTHAYLPCRVKQLGNKSVSWIRRRDAHILTVDRYTFIADDRFQAFLVEATDTWTLQVKYVQARDAGQYECQVSTEPKMSHFITLNVVVPKIEILGESDIYVKSGSTVTLKCVITQSLEEPAYIFWYHDGERVLNYDRSVIDIRMERVGSDTTVGTLIIYHSLPINSGNYTCSPSNLDSASVLLHVLNGEHPAAMQRGKNSASPIPGWSHLSMGLGLAACTSPRFAFAAAVTLAAIFQLLST